MNKEEYTDKFMPRAKQDIKICENEHELQVYIAGLLENIDYWQNEYNYMKKYRDTLQQENKELKEELDKYKKIVEEIKQIIYREMKTMGYAINDSCLMFMLDKIENLEKGDSNE